MIIYIYGTCAPVVAHWKKTDHHTWEMLFLQINYYSYVLYKVKKLEIVVTGWRCCVRSGDTPCGWALRQPWSATAPQQAWPSTTTDCSTTTPPTRPSTRCPCTPSPPRRFYAATSKASGRSKCFTTDIQVKVSLAVERLWSLFSSLLCTCARSHIPTSTP